MLMHRKSILIYFEVYLFQYHLFVHTSILVCWGSVPAALQVDMTRYHT